MCDTIFAASRHTATGATLFGKNSDRQRNEAQAVEYFAGASHAADAQVTCTYLSIPQVSRTHAVLLCRPFWMWGAEMGANEHGVAIGNEGVQTRSPPPEQPALTGMDLLRLALERSATAAEAVTVITSLLEAHGQGGNGGHILPAYYNNAFMIVDADEAYVLETLEREWLVERVGDIRAISNRYSIAQPDRVSAGLSRLIRESGWSEAAVTNHSEVIAHPNREHIGNAGARQASASALLASRAGHLTGSDMMRVLRDHGTSDHFHPQWRAEVTSMRTICMHAGAADRGGQTVGSMVSEISRRGSVHWVTATAAPCISIYKPVLLDVPLPSLGSACTDVYSAGNLWWRHETLHRAALLSGLSPLIEAIRPERDELEASFERRVRAVMNGGTVEDRAHVITECWREAFEAEEGWRKHIPSRPIIEDNAADSPYRREWLKLNRVAEVECG